MSRSSREGSAPPTGRRCEDRRRFAASVTIVLAALTALTFHSIVAAECAAGAASLPRHSAGANREDVLASHGAWAEKGNIRIARGAYAPRKGTAPPTAKPATETASEVKDEGPLTHGLLALMRALKRMGSSFGADEPPARPTPASAPKDETHCPSCHAVKWCNDCHGLGDMPHPARFNDPSLPAEGDAPDEAHSVTAVSKPEVCERCHPRSAGFCHRCHHQPWASQRGAWLKGHGAAANMPGSASERCATKCHSTSFCTRDCHRSPNAPPPASHMAARWVRDFSSATARHAQVYAQNEDVCKFCHDVSDACSDYCRSCHVLERMPHPAGYATGGGEHRKLLASGQLTSSVCSRCHDRDNCDECHHPDSRGSGIGWESLHRLIVDARGSEACLGLCHEETYCAHCHVESHKQRFR